MEGGRSELHQNAVRRYNLLQVLKQQRLTCKLAGCYCSNSSTPSSNITPATAKGFQLPLLLLPPLLLQLATHDSCLPATLPPPRPPTPLPPSPLTRQTRPPPPPRQCKDNHVHVQCKLFDAKLACCDLAQGSGGASALSQREGQRCEASLKPRRQGPQSCRTSGRSRRSCPDSSKEVLALRLPDFMGLTSSVCAC